MVREGGCRGEPPGAIQLALLYLAGRGVKRDEIEAFVWLTLAKRGGSPHAQKALEELNAMFTRSQALEAYSQLVARLKELGIETDTTVLAEPGDPEPETDD